VTQIPDESLARRVYAALDAAVDLSDFNLNAMTGNGREPEVEDFAMVAGALLKAIREQLVEVAKHVDDLEAEVRRLRGQR
jgi:hypothetical protein